jgi:hypothetical protein|tara:strand:+ start:16289 stop:17050 length:762 start_codon:yes stop_codon:yes gene_type:complete
MEDLFVIYFLLSFLCLLIGFLGGMMGIALGSVRLPIIIFFGFEPIIASSTNLIAVIFGSISGLIPAIKQKRVPIKSSMKIAFPSIIAAFLGGYYAVHFSERFIIITISICLFISGLVLFFNNSYEQEDNLNQGKLNSIKELFLGIFIAYFGGLIGIALGVLRVPALVYFLKMNIKTAGGVNLLLTVFIGSAAFLGHSFAGVIDYNLIFVVVLPTMIGMYLGSRKVMDLNQKFLNKFVGIFLVLLSLIFSIRFI